MPSVSQQDVERAVKKAHDSLHDLRCCAQQRKLTEAPKDQQASKDEYAQRQKLNKLSGTLHQQLLHLQKLVKKEGLREPQKRRLLDVQSSIEQELGKIQMPEQQIKVLEVEEHSQDLSQTIADSPDTSKGPGVAKVHWDQVIRGMAEESAMLEEFMCKICQVHLVGCEPKLARCSHLFCGDCIYKWFEVQPQSLSWAQRAQAKGLVPCPVCKEPLHKDNDLFPVCAEGGNESAWLSRILSDVKIVCANHQRCRSDGKCTWMGSYGSYQSHYQCCANVPLANKAAGVIEEFVNVAPESTKTMTSHTKVAASSSQTSQPHAALASAHDTECSHVASEETLPAVQHKSVQPVCMDHILEAVHPFIATDASYLTVSAGELVKVLNKHESGWTYGQKVDDKSNGWFPHWVLP